jgi:cytidyltransferase-like protein
MNNKKIINISDLSAVRKKHKKIVLAHGAFDFIHYGHILHLKKAKTLGDVLVVSITSDKFINKGPGRPIYNNSIRLNILSEFDFVDYVLVADSKTALEVIGKLKPNIYIKGSEYKNLADDIAGNGKLEFNAVKKNKGLIKFTDEKTFSASSLINYHTNVMDNNLKKYLEKIRNKLKINQISGKLDLIKKNKILIIGETIIDEYIFCESLAKSPKEEIISSKYIEKKLYLGGILATASHVSNFVNDVTLLSVLGNDIKLNNYITKGLKKNIKKIFFLDNSKKTILKTRFLEYSSKKKLFQVNKLDYGEISKKTQDKILLFLKKNLKNFDTILINDFGHGLLTPGIIKYLTQFSKKIFLNVQTNSANLGYNYFNKYSKCKYLSIDEPEARLGTKSRFSSSQELFKKIKNLTNYQLCSVTHGGQGTKICTNGKFFNAPALTNKFVDTVGAGDAYFAISSIFAIVEKDPELIALFGNIAGAMKIQYLGHEKNIEKQQFLVYLKSLLS